MSRLTKHALFPKEAIRYVDPETHDVLAPCQMKARHAQDVLEKLAEYEDKEEQNLLIELNRTVWMILCKNGVRGIFEGKITGAFVINGHVELDVRIESEKSSARIKNMRCFGAYVFYIKEQAEEALVRMENIEDMNKNINDVFGVEMEEIERA